MDKAEALAFVSRMFDTAAAGAVLWGDALLIRRASVVTPTTSTGA